MAYGRARTSADNAKKVIASCRMPNAANPLKRDIGVIITAFNKSTNMMEIQDQHYTNEAVINYSIRGFNTDARDFGVYVRQRFLE